MKRLTKLNKLVKTAEIALDEFHTLILKENLPKQGWYELDEDSAASLLATVQDVASMLETLKLRTRDAKKRGA